MINKMKKVLKKFAELLKEKIEQGSEKSQGIVVVELLVSAITLTTYCTISPILAEYQGKKLVYWAAVSVIVLLLVIAGWEFICLIGYNAWKGFFYGLYSVIKNVIGLILKWARSPRLIYIMPVTVIIGTCFGIAFWQFHTTEYYSSIVEIYGIPVGVGEPLSFEERKICADYWKIEDYSFRKNMVLTHEDSYHENEIMEQYSSIYNMAFFQPVDHMVYQYRKNKGKFQRLEDEKAYMAADANNFREPIEISYFNSSGKLLLKLKKEDDSDTFAILAYSVDSEPQLLNSTLLRIPEEEETDSRQMEERDENISRNAIGNSVRSQKIEVTYNSDGLPETRRISPHIYNLYGMNGERYVYNENKQLTELYYLDVNGDPVCNQKGIMMVSFEYGEGSRLTGIRYFSDENGEEKADGFNGVFCEKYEYNSDGNLCGRKQLNQSENSWYDKNGVCEYRYTYDEGRLSREEFFDFSGNKAYHEKVKSTLLEFAEQQDDAGNKEITVSLDQNNRLSEKDTFVSEEKTEGNKGQEITQDAIPVISDSVSEDRVEGENDKDEKENKKDIAAVLEGETEETKNREKDKSASKREAAGSSFFADDEEANAESSNTSQPDKREEDMLVRNYTKICYEINKKDNILKITYRNDNRRVSNERVNNERGFSGEQLNYDSKLRVKEKIYLDTHDDQCLTVDGYSRVVFDYISENGEEKERVEYQDNNGELAINRKEEYGYAYVEYKPYEEAENRNGDHTITLEYHDQNGKPFRLPEKGYSKVRQTYNERGLLVRETYYKEDEPAYRTDYMVAGIDYEYSDDGNLICEIYKDDSDQPVNRCDSGFAMRFQEFENGNLVKMHYKGYVDGMLQDVPDKRYGIGITKYIYANGRKVEEQYFDINGTPVLLSNYGYFMRKLEYNNRGLLTAVRFYGTDEELILRKDVGYAVITRQYDELGQEIFVHYYGVDEKPIISTYYYCAGMQYQYDENGNRSNIRYLDENNNLMTRSDLGYAGINRTYNEDGKIVKEQYFDSDGQPVECKEGGYAVYEGAYEGGNLVRVKYKDRNDKLVLHKDTGYAIVTYMYNEQGKCIQEEYFDTNAQLVISKKYHCAGFRYNYDEKVNEDTNEEISRETFWYLNLHGKPMIRSDLGYAKVCKQYDEFKHLIEETYYNTVSLPILCKEGGYAFFENKYDEKGNCVRTIYRDKKGELTLRKDTGYAVIENEFDDFGRCIRVSYYGTDYEVPDDEEDDMNDNKNSDEKNTDVNQKARVFHAEYGCAGFRYLYDEAGNRTDISYTDTKENIMVRRDLGYAKIHREYDGQGNLIAEYYYDVNNNPTTCREGGYASFKKTYKNGKCIEAAYYDTNGEPVLRNDQRFAIERWQYDELGQCISDAFYDTKGKPVINKKYLCAAFEYEYDSMGYQTDIRYRNMDGEILIRPDLGYAHVKKEYDNRGNLVKEFYYDEEERLTLTKEGGFAYFENQYDDAGNCLGGKCYGKNRELIIRKDKGFASFRNIYDGYGQWRAQYYYGADGGTPVISTEYHCAGFLYGYDVMGDRTSTKYVDTDGNIMIREDLGYAEQKIKTVYDSKTNSTTERGYFRDSEGQPVAKSEGGYTGYEDIYVCGKWVESRFYVGESKMDWVLTERTDKGYAIIKKEYDPFWQCVSESYYDEADQPVCYLDKDKETKVCAGFIYEYDERGNMIDIKYKGTEDNIMIRADLGYAQVCSEYDEQGNVTEERYYDADHRPTMAMLGEYFSVDWIYSNGNCTETRYYDEDKNLMLRSDGNYAIQREQYDEFDQRVLSSYYNTDGELVIHTWYGCATFEYRYDKLGNMTDIIYRDTNGDMMVRETRGFAWINQRYDEWGRLKVETYYDEEKNPTKDVDGYPGRTYEYEYDEQGNEKKEVFDLDGNKIN